jgi:hypothetical protein
MEIWKKNCCRRGFGFWKRRNNTYWSKKIEADFEIGEEFSEELIDLGKSNFSFTPKSYFKDTRTR